MYNEAAFAISVYVGVIICCLGYALLKERIELGCVRWSVKKQCFDENSVYVSGTRLEPGDSLNTRIKKLRGIVSYHEKAAVWRRCFIMATVITAFIFLIYKMDVCMNVPILFVIWHITTFFTLYFFFNFINYHHFRLLQKNAFEILDTMVVSY